MKKIIVIASVLALAGCTDAVRARYSSLGNQADITCFSGGQAVFTDVSSGKIQESDGEGIGYQSQKTGKYVRVFADCVVVSR
jgi:hypothetical protein